MKRYATILATLSLNGCLSAVPSQPITPQNSAQVSACESAETWHNIAIITGIGLSATTAGLGTAGSMANDSNTKTDLAVTSIGVGVAAAVMTTIAGIEAADYSNSGCQTVIGPLPIAEPNPTR